MKKLALITGTTSGIGKATAIILAKNGYNLIITGRRKNLLAELENEIKKISDAEILSLNFDVRKLTEVEKFILEIPEKWKNIDVLVNNAGLAVGLNPIQEGVIDDWERMIDTNIKGLLYVSRLVIPLMIERKIRGHIINIGSIAGKEVYANGNVYCASKFAVDALSKGMRADLLQHAIKVTSISPGMVETEFSLVRFKGDDQSAKKFYEGLIPLAAEDIAETILFALSRPPHVNINDIYITPLAQASAYYVKRDS
jgi:3-hydroxy acid dehydrogenase / malonic semialdehyde reductase